MKRIARMVAVAGISALLACGAAAAPTQASAMPPHLEGDGQSDYQNFLAAATHKAFAIAPGGAWGWKANAPSREQAVSSALATCQAQTPQRCVLYATDGALVWDSALWPTLWGPYTNAAQSLKAPIGRERGQRFYNIALRDAKAQQTSKVQSLRGKVVVLHFWGAWCGPCRREMPELQKLYDSLKSESGIAFVLLQVREPFATSQQWASKQGLHLPLFDSGARSMSDTALQVVGGDPLPDREVASVFPSSYVLDKRGIVVFNHTGPVTDWMAYREFLLDAVRKSGK